MTRTQHDLFLDAVRALGGQVAVARLLNVTDRTVRGLMSGDRPLHTGYLRDISQALLGHAEYCRELERNLNPLFDRNLTDQQRAERPDGRRYDAAEPAKAEDLANG